MACLRLLRTESLLRGPGARSRKAILAAPDQINARGLCFTCAGCARLGYSDLLHMLRLISAFRRLELENNTARQYSSRASIQRSRFQESGGKQTRKALITLESHVMPTREAQSAAVAACAFQLLQLSPVSAGTLSRQQRSDAAIGPLRFDISILGILSSRPCCDL